MRETIIECRSLQKSFCKNHKVFPVLHDVQLSAALGEAVVISGKSGEGKSVLLWLIAQLDRPTGGEVIYKGTPLKSMRPESLAKLRRNEICIIFQDFNLIPIWSALENVTAAMLHSDLKKKQKIELAASMLEKAGLADKLDHFPSELSIGQRQRVAIARNLINNPALIVADEPTGGLDPETADTIINLLLEPVRANRAALIAATHGNFPLAAADRVLYLREGTLTPA